MDRELKESLRLILKEELHDIRSDINELKVSHYGLKTEVIEKTDKLSAEIKSIDEKTDKLSVEVKSIDEKTDKLSAEVKSIDEKTDKLSAEVKSNGEKIDNLSTEMRGLFIHVEDKLDQHHKVFNVVADEIKSIKIDIDYLNRKTAKHDMKINNIEKKLQS